MRVKNIFIVSLLSLSSNISLAATTDCIQLAVDGTVNCTSPVIERWANGTPPNISAFPNFSDSVDFETNKVCSNSFHQPIYSCRNKDFTGSWDGLNCSGLNCASLTGVETNNASGKIYYSYHNNTNPIAYYVGGGVVYYHQFFCLPNYSVVYPTSGSNLDALCKPTYPSLNNDTWCSDGSCGKDLSTENALKGGSTSGDPVSNTTGSHYVVEEDYNYQSFWPLSFNRLYIAKYETWSHNWNFKLNFTNYASVGGVVSVTLPSLDTFSYKYNTSTGLWDKTNSSDSNKLLYDNTTGVFTYILGNNKKIKFQPKDGANLINSNRWVASKIIEVGGGEYNLSYDSFNLLNKITNPNNIKLIVNQNKYQTGCNNVPVITSIVGPSNTTTNYTYNSSCKLINATYPDGSYKTYEYAVGSYLKIKDELNQVYNYTTYTTSSSRTGYVASVNGLGSTGTVNKNSFTYSASNTVVKDAFNNSITINNIKQNSQTKASSYSSLCTFCDGIQGSNISYNSNGFITNITDYNGNTSEIVYDTNKNLITKIKEATNSTSLQRETSFVYDSDWNLPVTITKPSSVLIAGSYNNNVSNNTYDNSTGKLLQTSITAPKNDGTNNTDTKVWQFSYDNLNQLTEIKNPMYSTSYNDKINLSYNSNGQVNSVTNGLNQNIYLTNFNNYGQPQLISYPDNTSLSLSYNSRGMIVSVTKNNSGNTANFTTLINRNAAQLVTKITSPSGSYNELIYDTTQRLTEIKEYDDFSVYQGKLVFTLDNMSNVTKTQVFDAMGNEIILNTKQYNNKNMLYKDLTSLNYATTYTYDNNGNLSVINDANNKNLIFTYDALNRITQQTNQDTGVIVYNYNPDDSLASVVDPKSLATNYTYNGFGELISISSPDSGLTTISRNLNGDVVSKTDARNITTSYNYDVLHRVTNVNYPTTADNTIINYDSCKVGKLCSIVDISGTLTYTYDDFARLLSQNYNDGNGFNKTTIYNYDNYNRLNKIIYPSGKEINYSLNGNKVVGVSYVDSGNTFNIITNGVYNAFNSNIKSYNFGDVGNNVTYSKSFDKDGMVSNISTSIPSVLNKNYTFDSRLNINGINGVGLSDSAVINYDNNSRITNFNYGNGIVNNNYVYNTSGDRTSVINTMTETYSYPSNSHKLSSVNNNNYFYDNNGNTTGDGNKVFTYNDANRLVGFADGVNSFSYLINTMGQRVKKSDLNNSSNNKKFVYANTDLIAEYDNSGNVTDEYVYLNGAVIGLIRNNNLYYVYSDYLGVPRTITDTNNNVKWSWENVEPFGNSQPVEINNFKYNPRLVGQYYDEESGLNYNYYRDYNSKLGRYIESDPIGLNGGINTYSYAGGNGLSFVDKFGLDIVNLLSTSDAANYPLLLPRNNNNVLRIVAHGNKESFTDNSGSNKISYFNNQEGLFENQKNVVLFFETNIVAINYFNKMQLLKKPILIHLDACSTANESFAKNLSKSLYNKYNNDVYIIAPKNPLENIFVYEKDTYYDERKNIISNNIFMLYKNGKIFNTNQSYKVLYEIVEVLK